MLLQVKPYTQKRGALLETGVVESISKRVSQAQMKNSSGLNRRSGDLVETDRPCMYFGQSRSSFSQSGFF